MRRGKAPDGWEHLDLAVKRFGAAYFGPIFLWNVDFAQKYPLIRNAEDLWGDSPPDHDWYEALYTLQLCERFCQAVYNGHLKASYRPIGGGVPEPTPLGWWSCDDPRVRFLTQGVNPEDPYGVAEPTHRIFIEWSGLNRAMGLLREARANLPILSREYVEQHGEPGSGVNPRLPGEVHIQGMTDQRVPVRIYGYPHRMVLAPAVMPLFGPPPDNVVQFKSEAPFEQLPLAASEVSSSRENAVVAINARRVDQPTERHVRVAQHRVEQWFRDERCPAFEGARPPIWQECWAAAKEKFAPAHVVREVLLAARSAAAPAEWSKPGPRSPAN